MAVDRVESLRAYRSTLQRRFDQATHAALESVPGGEWEGMEVLRRKALEDVIHQIAEADPEPVPTSAEVRTPGRVFVDVICPRCDLPTRVLLEVSAELVVTTEGSEIKAKGRSRAQAHTCGQLALEAAGDPDQEQMRLADLVGPTEPTLVVRTDVSAYSDVSLSRPENERCGAEAEYPEPEDGDDLTLVCERIMDHDATELHDDPREHWAEGGYAWHYEERPVPLGRTNEVAADQEENEDEA